MTAKTKARPTSARNRKARDKAVLYVLIDDEQQRALRVLAFMRQVPMSDVVREAIAQYISTKGPTTDDVEGVVKLLRKSVRAK